MRRRSERQQDFEAIKNNLYAAGVSTVKAAKAQEEMFTTTLEALSEAYEGMEMNPLEAGEDEPSADLTLLVDNLLAQRQAAMANQDYGAYVEAEEKLQRLEEFAVLRVERQVRLLVAQRQLTRLAGHKEEPTPAPQQESAPEPKQEAVKSKPWTEAALKKQYKTLDAVRQAFNVSARTWKEAVKQLNA
jgi:hypothetical protein